MEDGEGPRIKGGGRTKGGEGDSETEGDTVSRTGGTSGPTGTNALVFLTLVIGEKAINISQMVFIVINSEEKVSGVMGPHHLSVCVCVGTTVCVFTCVSVRKVFRKPLCSTPCWKCRQ